ncbi:hypothetical protein DERP_005911 [Dermatophagoides pteronyssinus]|uniref:Uncharacterized protein n=1 Tax=Dermatophagoides pteronyssinus TaxID=6956 RepID=A0ABQ8JRS3_DERPT|nr:hypothetical protein DERP_005911 [Dermatophagoides pteronyssinus]
MIKSTPPFIKNIINNNNFVGIHLIDKANKYFQQQPKMTNFKLSNTEITTILLPSKHSQQIY